MKTKTCIFCTLFFLSPTLTATAESTQNKADIQPEEIRSFNCGDANTDGRVDLSDAVFITEVLFRKKHVNCFKPLDINCDGRVDTTDPLYLLYMICVKGETAFPPPS